MIGLDTNVLVRFLVQDDADQAVRATTLIASLTTDAPGFIAREVMVELVWVLDRAYGYSKAEIADALNALLEARDLVVETPAHVARALDRYVQGQGGFADHMIALAGEAAGCTTLMTFDKSAAKAPGVTLL